MFAWIALHASILVTFLELFYRYFILPIKLFIIYILTTIGIPF